MQNLFFLIEEQILTWKNPCRNVIENTKGKLIASYATDTEWDGLTKIAVFQHGMDEPVRVPVIEDSVEIPPEVIVAGELRVGLVGLGSGGTVQIPTRWMNKPIIVHPSTPVTGKGPEAISPELWEQALAAIGNLPDLETEDKSSIVAAINEVLSVAKAGGGGSEGSGTDGREVELSVVNGYIAWRYTGETKWRNLIATSELTGPEGKPGTSVTVSSVSESTEDDGTNVVTFSDGKTLSIKNGKAGTNGKDGSPGAKGDPGYTPQRGTDYWTPADQEQIVSDVLAALPIAEEAVFGG